MIFYADESSFNLFPNLVKSYFRKGMPSVVKRFLPFKGINVISAVSPQGELIYHVRNSRFLGIHMADFLRKLRKGCTKSNITVIWDRVPTHYAKEVKELLNQLEDRQLELYLLPAHSPELNPDEQVWKYLKTETDLRNLACKSFAELRQRLIHQLEQLKANPDRIKKMFHHPACAFY